MGMRVSKFGEWCPNCESENEFELKGRKLYICHNCGYALAPCSLCDMDNVNCAECELAEIAKEANEKFNK